MQNSILTLNEESTLDALILHSLPGLAFVCQADGRLVQWNRGFHTLLDWGNEALVSKSVFDLLEPKDREQTRASLANLGQGGQFTFQVEILHRDGRALPFHLTGVAVNFNDQPHLFVVGTDLSKYVAAEAALAQSERNYRQIFDSVNDALLIHDADGRVIDANERACVLYGCSRDALLGLGPAWFSQGESRYSASEAAAMMQRALREGPQLFESISRRANGESFWVEVSLRAAEIGGKRCVIASVRDIGERKRSEALLRENERLLATAMSATQDAVCEFNIQTDEAHYSSRWYEMLGYGDQEFKMDAATWKNLCHPDDRERVIRDTMSVLDDRATRKYAVEFRVRRADDTWAWILARGAVTERDAEGRPTRISSTYSDITLRREAELEIAQWKQRYELLLQAAGEIVFDTPLTGTAVFGGAVEAVLGYTDAEMQGAISRWPERIHPDDRDRVTTAFQTAIAQGTVFREEFSYRHKNGEYVALCTTAYPRFDESGTLVRFVGSMVDVTERRKAEVERQRLEDRLRQAQKMESIGRLAGGIAHDFNNLLTAISGNLSLAMLEGQIDSATRELLGEVDKAAQSAARLTRQLLTFSRKQLIVPKVLCVNDTVQRAETLLRRLIGEDIDMRVTLCPSLGRSLIDEGQLEQILVNLAVNARDAMPMGGKLTIETANIVLDADYCRERGGIGSGNYVLLAVSDSGTGMTAEVKERIFEPFFTTKEVGKGTGLGLAMVYGAVRQNHGMIEVYSEVGLGTSVHIYLPRSDAALSQVPELPLGDLVGGTETIMLVEDADAVRDLAARILSRQGYRLLVFNNGEKALRAIHRMEQPVDLLLTDVVMPGMNGRTLADRATALIPGLRVLFTSGYSEDAIMHHGVLDQGIEFIAKPYSVERLVRCVRAVLDRRSI